MTTRFDAANFSETAERFSNEILERVNNRGFPPLLWRAAARDGRVRGPERRPGVRRGDDAEAMSARQVQVGLRDVLPVSARAGEDEEGVRAVLGVRARQGQAILHRVQRLPARQDPALLQRVQPVPPRHAQAPVPQVQPVPARQAQGELRAMQTVSPRQAQASMRDVLAVRARQRQERMQPVPDFVPPRRAPERLHALRR